MRKQAAILANMNTQTEAERDAAQAIANSVRSTALAYSAGYAPDDGDAAAGALCAKVAETLLGEVYAVVPRYVLRELRNALGDAE